MDIDWSIHNNTYIIEILQATVSFIMIKISSPHSLKMKKEDE